MAEHTQKPQPWQGLEPLHAPTVCSDGSARWAWARFLPSLKLFAPLSGCAPAFLPFLFLIISCCSATRSSIALVTATDSFCPAEKTNLMSVPHLDWGLPESREYSCFVCPWLHPQGWTHYNRFIDTG